MAQVPRNRIGSAFVHVPSSERIDIGLTARDDTEIQVQDYGEGIQPQQKKSISSRFSSLDRMER